jgi:hypothetical protein
MLTMRHDIRNRRSNVSDIAPSAPIARVADCRLVLSRSLHIYIVEWEWLGIQGEFEWYLVGIGWMVLIISYGSEGGTSPPSLVCFFNIRSCYLPVAHHAVPVLNFLW